MSHIFRYDGNFVIYKGIKNGQFDPKKAVWATNTALSELGSNTVFKQPFYLIMQQVCNQETIKLNIILMFYL